MSGEHMLDDENDCWYDANGNCDENGCYDAGGHFYAERATYAADAYMDRVKEGDA
jgi:hypothetical protein